MKTLILMRHAKSSWDDPLLEDHQRRLNKRGRAAASAMGAWLRDHAYVPDQALVSDAARTKETFARLGFTCAPDFLNRLYHAGPATQFNLLKGATGDHVLMLGHNPGIAEFAAQLVTTPPDHPRFDDYPTCATLVVAFDIGDWSELAPYCGTVRDFIVPADIDPHLSG